MLARLLKALTSIRGEKLSIFSYAALITMSAGVSVLMVSDIDGEDLLWGSKGWFIQWVIFAGALSGGIGLKLARGWMGLEGVLGVLRALVGSVAIAIMAAMVAGLLIYPLFGVVYGPVLLLTEFIAKPWLAVAWLVVAMSAHFLQLSATRERSSQSVTSAISHLSQLSQVNLYKRS